MRGKIILLLAWVSVVLACNLPLQPRAEPLSPPTLPAESAELQSDDATEVAEDEVVPNATATLLPVSGATTEGTVLELAPTVTPRATPSGDIGGGDDETLELDYVIEWELNSADTDFALATVTLLATGGDGEYRFFRDDILTGGSQFVYRWGSCKANPGSFRVDSGDGQSVVVEYYEETPCP